MIPVERALERANVRYAPDERVTCFDVEASVESGRIVLQGVVQTKYVRDGVRREVARSCDGFEIDSALEILDERGRGRRTTRRVEALRSDPDPTSEQLTQVLYGSKVIAYDESDGWRRVRAPDGYLGWIDSKALLEPSHEEAEPDTIDGGPDGETGANVDRTDTGDGTAITTGDHTFTTRPSSGSDPFDAIVVSVPTAVQEGSSTPETVPAGTLCRIESSRDEELTVTFGTGARGTLDTSAVRRLDSLGTGTDVCTLARAFLGTSYEWGGMTAEGIDCSGLSWIAYACAGLELPRDTDQQERLGVEIERDDLAAGDLLFFPGHVAISLGGSRYIHAHGPAGEVRINSFDRGSEQYLPSLDESFRTAKRLL